MSENEIARIVFWSGLKVHRALGPGLLESAYEACLCFEFEQEGLFVEKQKPIPIIYEYVQLDVGYRVDLFLENKFIVEVKSVASLTDVHMAQILTYLKLSDCKLGMLINFNTCLFKDGVKRVINGRL
jgi:GxxExxY protein